ncbi:MAG: gas vesicle protein GvpG [Syntrophus sp. (in: bacteria)]|nr:gas vesicle protein GvpG [Syntrophus sp. (in: bacteria)]MBA4418907.1 gas vesicle protein GvpG [Syntrophus sp. (in: bacteria)]
MFLIDDIVFSPLKGLIWLSEKINDMVEREMSDEGLIKERLMELQLRFELDAIDEETYMRQEKELLERLNAIHGDEG